MFVTDYARKESYILTLFFFVINALADYGLIYEVNQYSNADGQVANRIYIGNVMTYDAEKYKQERIERQEKAFQKRQEQRQKN